MNNNTIAEVYEYAADLIENEGFTATDHTQRGPFSLFGALDTASRSPVATDDRVRVYLEACKSLRLPFESKAFDAIDDATEAIHVLRSNADRVRKTA